MINIGRLVGSYKRSKTRASRMRVHWKLSHLIAKEYHQDIQYSRTLATTVIHGGEIGGVGMTRRYQYIWLVIGETGKTNLSVISDIKLGKREQKSRIRKSFEENKDKYPEDDPRNIGEMLKLKFITFRQHYYSGFVGVKLG